MKPLAPKTVLQNRYQITKLIGKGGMGEVYLAIDQRLGHSIALKRTTVGDDAMLADAFEREAKTLAQLRHPVLPKVSDHFGEDDEQFLVMDYISGQDLSERLQATDNPFPLNWVLFWADQLLEALTYLHNHEPMIIHRDIKPQNLKLTDDNHIVLLDFGLSKNALGNTKVTTSGSVVGYTPHYAPMEQIRGTGTNSRSDIFSLASTLYHIATNVIPSDALTRADAMLAGMPDPLKSPMEANPEISQEISDAILKGMEISQEKRFGSAREMQKVMRRAYNKTLESMSAQTIAFKADGSVPDPVEINDSAMKTEVFQDVAVEPDNSGAKTDVFLGDPGEDVDAGARTEVIEGGILPDEEPSVADLDATVAFNHEPEVQASFENVEVDSGAEDEIEIPLSEDVPSEIPSVDDFKTSEDLPVEEAPIPDATVPFILQETDSAETASNVESLPDAVVTSWESETDRVVGEETTNFAATEANVDYGEVSESEEDVVEPVSEVAVAESVGANVPPAKRGSSTGKYLAILGGLGVILLMVFGALGVGLYYTNGGFGFGDSNTEVTDSTPEPTPEPTIETEPEITPQVLVTDQNPEVNTAASPENSEDIGDNTSVTGETTEVADSETPEKKSTSTRSSSSSSSSTKRPTTTVKSRPTTTTTVKTTKRPSRKTNSKVRPKQTKPKTPKRTPQKKKKKDAGVL